MSIGIGYCIPNRRGISWSSYWENLIRDGSTAIWLDATDETTLTVDGSNRVSLWKDKLLQTDDYGADYVIYGDNETQKTTVSVSRLTTAQSSEQAHGGTYSSKVVHTATAGVHYLYINVTISKQYLVSVWVYIPSGQANVDTITLGSGGSGDFAHTNTKDQWVQLTATVTPGFNSISLSAGNSSSENEYWYFDDWTIKEVSVAHDLVQADTDKMPTYSSSGVLFDGTDDYMQSRPFEITQPSTIYMVAKIHSFGGSRHMLDTVWRGSINFYPKEAGGLYRPHMDGDYAEHTLEGYEFFIIRLKINGATSYLQLNNYTAVEVDGQSYNLDGITLGCKYNLGNFSNIEFREVIVRNGIDEANDYANIYNYLVNKHSTYLALYGAFAAYGSNPILSPTAPSTYAAFASVLKVGSIYHMYYHGQAAGSGVYHATSTDGLTWTKDDANNPVLEVGTHPDWDYANVGVPVVWYEGGTWYMLYRGDAGSGGDRTGLATSSDGITWTKDLNNPVLVGEEGEWDENGAESWGLIKVGSTYYVFYEAVHSNSSLGRSIGIATSTDLVNWSKDANNPIMTGGRFCPFIFKYGSYYYLLVPHYQFVSDYSEIEIYRDTNPTFYSGDREYLGTVKKPSASGWDSADEDTPWILTDDIFRDTFVAAGGQLWLYYSGDAGSNVWSEGLLIADDI